MRFIVIGNQWALDILKRGSDETIDWQLHDHPQAADCDAFFYLNDDPAALNSVTANLHIFDKKPVFLNSVITSLKEMNAGNNIYRVNGWRTFLERNSWELAGNVSSEIAFIFKQLNRTFIHVPDQPGLIAARIISMIINEGYFALEESVSTKSEMDTAMKLGTNYPYGPFEWGDKIGIAKVHALLQKMAETDERFIPCTLLTREAGTL